MPSALLLLGPDINGGFTPACGLVSLSGLNSVEQNFFLIEGGTGNIFKDFPKIFSSGLNVSPFRGAE